MSITVLIGIAASIVFPILLQYIKGNATLFQNKWVMRFSVIVLMGIISFIDVTKTSAFSWQTWFPIFASYVGGAEFSYNYLIKELTTKTEDK